MGRHEEAIERHGFRFKHSLGQNFLVNNAVIEKIMARLFFSERKQNHDQFSAGQAVDHCSQRRN